MARVKHYQQEWLSYHITTRTKKQEFHLRNSKEKLSIINTLDFYRRKKSFKLFGFVVMDNHLHFVIQPLADWQLGEIVRDIKSWTSRSNKLKPPGQELWERRFDDNCVKSAKELRNILEYIHNNPVRAGMAKRPEDYVFSSFHNYFDSGKQTIDIDSDWWQF